MAAYATTDDWIKAYDWRRLGELLNDRSRTPTDVVQVTTSDTAAELLLQASGEIDAACRVGQRYSQVDLATLIGVNPNSAALLRRLCCDLAFELACSRRGLSAREVSDFAPRAVLAREMLQALRDGERILDDAGQAAQAGVEVDNVHAGGINSLLHCRLLSSDRGAFGRAGVGAPWWNGSGGWSGGTGGCGGGC